VGLTLAFALIAFLGALAFVRLAPSDPAVWHVDLAAPGFDPGSGQVFCLRPGGRYAPSEPMETVLARLDAVALATSRTERLAGSVAEGRITWVTRSRLMGYPDYTTAQVMAGPGLCVFGRQRFGRRDWGVNAARIGGWMQEVLGLTEVPDMTGIPTQP
jgi:Protein of unknown function (DUF1499)